MLHGQDTDSYLLRRGGAGEQLKHFSLLFTKISRSFSVIKQKSMSKFILAGQILLMHFYQWATEN